MTCDARALQKYGQCMLHSSSIAYMSFPFIASFTILQIQKCVLDIYVGDDCISIVNASSNIKMKKIYCGPGHGIR